MTGMENVLAAHGVRSACHGETLCACGDGVWRGNSSRAKHIAGALTAAGFGSQHDAWNAGYTVGNAHNGRRDANPYPKVSET